MHGVKNLLSTTRQRLRRKRCWDDTDTGIPAPNDGNVGSNRAKTTVSETLSKEGFATSATRAPVQNREHIISSNNGINGTPPKKKFKKATAPKKQMEATHSALKLLLSDKKEYLLRVYSDGDRKNVGKLLSGGFRGMTANDYLQCMRRCILCAAANVKHKRFIVNNLVKHLNFMPFFECLVRDMEDLWLYVDSGNMNTLCGVLTDLTKLHLMGSAVKNPGNNPLVQTLLNSRADPNVRYRGEPVFLTAARSANLEVIQALFDRTAAANGQSSSLQAAGEKHSSAASERVLDINITGRNKQTALHIAVTDLDPETLVVKLLLDQGADVSAADDDGETALHKAARRNQTNSIDLLLVHDADIAAADTRGRTALHLAAERNHVASVKLLLAREAPIVPKTEKGKTPIQLAGDNEHREIFNVLREHVGLPVVRGMVHIPPSAAGGQETELVFGNDLQQRGPDKRSNVHEFRGEWPGYAIQNQQTREWSTLTPHDARYWD